MRDVRGKIVAAVGVGVVIPMLIANVLIMRWASGKIGDNPGAILVLLVVSLVLVAAGVAIVRSIGPIRTFDPEPPPPEPGKSCCCGDGKKP